MYTREKWEASCWTRIHNTGLLNTQIRYPGDWLVAWRCGKWLYRRKDWAEFPLHILSDKILLSQKPHGISIGRSFVLGVLIGSQPPDLCCTHWDIKTVFFYSYLTWLFFIFFSICSFIRTLSIYHSVSLSLTIFFSLAFSDKDTSSLSSSSSSYSFSHLSLPPCLPPSLPSPTVFLSVSCLESQPRGCKFVSWKGGYLLGRVRSTGAHMGPFSHCGHVVVSDTSSLETRPAWERLRAAVFFVFDGYRV